MDEFVTRTHKRPVEDVLRIELMIWPPYGPKRAGDYMHARYAYGWDQITSLRIGPTPSADDLIGLDLFHASLRRRRAIVDGIAANIAHDIIKVMEEMDVQHEAAP